LLTLLPNTMQHIQILRQFVAMNSLHNVKPAGGSPFDHGSELGLSMVPTRQTIQTHPSMSKSAISTIYSNIK
jgi:hypothetical protein